MSDADLEVLWRTALGSWGLAAAHAALLDACKTRGELAWAAGRYRAEAERAERDGESARANDAKKRLAAIALVAMSELEAQRSARSVDAKPAEWPKLFLLAVLCAVLAALLYAARRELFG